MCPRARGVKTAVPGAAVASRAVPRERSCGSASPPAPGASCDVLSDHRVPDHAQRRGQRIAQRPAQIAGSTANLPGAGGKGCDENSSNSSFRQPLCLFFFEAPKIDPEGRSFARARRTCGPQAVASANGVATSHPDKARCNSGCRWGDRAGWDLLVRRAFSHELARVEILAHAARPALARSRVRTAPTAALRASRSLRRRHRWLFSALGEARWLHLPRAFSKRLRP